MSHQGGQALRVTLGGTYKICCVHDREKRQVTTEERVHELAKAANFAIKPGIHFLHECACCENLFVTDGVTERYCPVCTRPLVHALGGPLEEPKGVVA